MTSCSARSCRARSRCACTTKCRKVARCCTCRSGDRAASANPELTDNTLSTNLLLLDSCIAELKHSDPRARHWLAKFVAHADERNGGRELALGVQSFIEAYLEDVGIGLVSAAVHSDESLRLSFRPAMGQLRCEPLTASTQRLQQITEPDHLNSRGAKSSR